MDRTLGREDRMRLLAFVCSFAWSDQEVQDQERSFVERLAAELDLDPEERRQVKAWLALPPRPEEVDPQEIPAEHRDLFIQAARRVIAADGVLDPDERETLDIFERLLAG